MRLNKKKRRKKIKKSGKTPQIKNTPSKTPQNQI